MAGNTIKFLIEMRDGASKPLKRVGKSAEDAAENAENATTRYTELASKLTLLGIAAKGASKIVSAFAKPLFAIAKGGIAAGSQMEGFETQLTVLMGSSSAAKERLEELFQIGTTTPFQLPGLIEAEVNLRALGVNAEKALPMVMDFAGAMKVDLATAAVEVGRAMQFGAGAVESVAGKSLRAQVMIREGIDPLKMSVDEFRESLIKTLTDSDGMFAGGTAKLAATFDGMLSNLQDAFFKFQKEVGDAGLFVTAKATLISVLDLLDKNQASTKNFATVVSRELVGAFFSLISALSNLIKLTISWTIGLKSVKLVVGTIGVAFGTIGETVHTIITGLRTMRSLMPTESIGQALQLDKAAKDSQESLIKMRQSLLELKLANAETHQEIFQLQETYEDFGTGTEKLIESIKKKTEELNEANKKAQGKTGTRTAQTEASARTETETKTKAKKTKEDEPPTAEELEESMRDALMGTEALLKDASIQLADLQYKLSPAGLAEGLVNKLTDSFGALTSMMGPAGGLVQSLSILGQEGAGKITKALKQSIEGLIVGLVDVLPKLIVSIPRAIINAVPDLIEGIFLAIPALAEAILIGLPVAVANGLARWFRIAIATIEAIFFPKKAEREKRQERRARQRESGTAQGALFAGGGGLGATLGEFLRLSTRKKHTGVSHIDRTGAFLLQAGEAVIPNSGTTTQGMDRRMGGRGGMNVTINTNVVDKNAIRGLGKLLEQEFSSFGRSTSPVFNSPTGTTG